MVCSNYSQQLADNLLECCCYSRFCSEFDAPPPPVAHALLLPMKKIGTTHRRNNHDGRCAQRTLKNDRSSTDRQPSPPPCQCPPLVLKFQPRKARLCFLVSSTISTDCGKMKESLARRERYDSEYFDPSRGLASTFSIPRFHRLGPS